MIPKPKYIVIPEIAGRIIVGEQPEHWITRLNAELAISYWIQVAVSDEDGTVLHDFDGCRIDWSDEEARIKGLSFFMAASNQAGTKFYMFPSPIAWEMAAAALMARYGWRAPYIALVIDALTGLTLDLKEAEATYKAWLEKGTAQR